MMQSFQTNVPLWVVKLVILCVILTALILSFIAVEGYKLAGLLGGLIGGLLVYIVNFTSEAWALRKLVKFKRMKVRNLLENRHDKIYYKSMLQNSSNEVKVMGASCSRFLDDFLDTESDDKVLVDKLRQIPTFSIQMLIPDQQNMNSRARKRFELSADKLTKLTKEFGERVQLRRFSYRARHSFVISDDELIAGPIFAEDMSQHAPAVHVSVSTAFGKKYDEYFVKTWGQCVAVSDSEHSR